MRPNEAEAAKRQPNILQPIVTLSVIAVSLVAGAFGLSTLLIFVAMGVTLPNSIGLDPAAALFNAVIAAYYGAVSVCLAIGLRRNSYWSWDGTVCLLSACGMIGIVVTAIGVVGSWIGALAGVTLVSVAGFILRLLITPVARGNFSFVPHDGRATPSYGLRVVAAYHLLLAGMQFAEAINPSPARILGVLLRGVPLILYAAITGTASLYVGYGLYAMRRWAYRIGIAVNLWSITTLTFWMLSEPGGESPTLTISLRIVMA